MKAMAHVTPNLDKRIGGHMHAVLVVGVLMSMEVGNPRCVYAARGSAKVD